MRRSLTLAAFVVLVAPSFVSADWLSLKSDHFLIIGEVGARDLQNVALRFEQFRDVISQLNPSILREGNAPPVVILVFKDKSTYKPFMPVTNGSVVPVGGLFQPGHDVNYITLTLESADQGFPVVFHEFSHLLLRGVFADAPLWFNEGLAEYYSTFEVTSSRRANIGKPVPQHVILLRSRSLPFARFFAIDRKSPEYTKDTIGRELLYAQAWAIVHHAFHGDSKRRDQLIAFVTRLADGGSTEDSFRTAYGIEVRDLESEVRAYVQQLTYGYMGYEFRDDLVTRVESRATRISDAEADAWLGDLLSHMNREADATARLEKALAAQNDLALAHASLGTLQLRQGKTAEGMAHLKQAQALGTANETAYFLYANGLLSEGAPAALPEASRALQRAIALRPGYTEAKLALAYTYLALGDYTAARDLLIPVVRAERTNHRAALRLGEALLALNDLAGARTVVGPVMARSTDAAEKERARTLLGRSADLQMERTERSALADPSAPPVDRPSAGTGGVTTTLKKFIPTFRTLNEGERRDTGVFEAIECGQNGMVFVVRTAAGTLRTSAARFEDVEFFAYRPLASQSINCGAQAPAMPVYLTWRPPSSASAGAVQGTAVAIEVLPENFQP